MSIISLKVAVFGGAGMFGSRLCDLLLRDGHRVWILGRSGSADATAERLGCQSLRLDRGGDLAALWALNPDVVVDAAGPFQAYGDDPYRLPRACIEHGVHYFDLCDTADFCIGIAAQHNAALAKGLAVYSGVSTVPALSSAIVSELAQGLRPESLDVAILPGNKTDRGRAVTESIMDQAGREFEVTLGGRKAKARNWQRGQVFTLPQGIRRKGRLFNLPDAQIFSGHFNIPTVRAWAGLELWPLDLGLWFYGWLGIKRRWMVTASLFVANILKPLGSDAGGMVVRLSGWKDDQPVTREFRLLVKDGQGPYVPTVAVRAVLRDLTKIPKGAGPALNIVSKTDCLDAMSDLPATTEEIETQPELLFPSVIGPDFETLPDAVKASHQTLGIHYWVGRGSVKRGKGFWSQALATLFRFPKATNDIAVQVQKTRCPKGETWVRTFGKRHFKSYLPVHAGKMHERFGPFQFELDLHVEGDQLLYPVARGWVLGVPLPKFFLPTSIAAEGETEGVFHFDVKLLAPITKGLMVHYQGHLRPSPGESE